MSNSSEPLNLPGYVVVEGPIGAGKTSLVRRMAKTFGSDLLLEKPEENPFLGSFYQDRKTAALPTQLCFLFQRSKQLESLNQGDLFRQNVISDFMFEKDRLFADLNLDSNELSLYEQVADKIAMEMPVP
ncbi:MAG: deoxynucleoside kinase, partial [bacterium]